MNKGINLQDANWREFPEFADNTATIDIDNVRKGTDIPEAFPCRLWRWQPRPGIYVN